MSSGPATSVVMALFLVVTAVVFSFLINSWTDRSFDTSLTANRLVARVESAISVQSTAQSKPWGL